MNYHVLRVGFESSIKNCTLKFMNFQTEKIKIKT